VRKTADTVLTPSAFFFFMHYLEELWLAGQDVLSTGGRVGFKTSSTESLTGSLFFSSQPVTLYDTIIDNQSSLLSVTGAVPLPGICRYL
jgi:hypothetical protein